MISYIYTNRKPFISMPQISTTKKYLLVKRAKIIKFLKTEGYSQEDISTMFNIDKSAISRILRIEKNYKEVAKKLLSDKKTIGR